MKRFDFHQKALSDTAAHQILSNVFHICDMEPNSVPLESIHDYSNYRRQRSAFEQAVIYIVLILFMLLPLLFVTGSINWSTDSGSAIYTVTADSPIPADSISASIDNHSVPASLMNDGSFILSPNRNGEMNVVITLKNRQELSTVISVTDVDEELPLYGDIRFEPDFIYINVYDDSSGINADKITVTDESGADLEGWRYDPEEGCIILPYTEHTLLISVPDMNNNVLKLQLTR